MLLYFHLRFTFDKLNSAFFTPIVENFELTELIGVRMDLGLGTLVNSSPLCDPHSFLTWLDIFENPITFLEESVILPAILKVVGVRSVDLSEYNSTFLSLAPKI